MQSTVRTAVLRILYSYVRPYSVLILTQLLQYSYRILSTRTAVRTVRLYSAWDPSDSTLS
jgi:hypothetical protein